MPSGTPYNYFQGHHLMGRNGFSGVPISIKPFNEVDLGDEDKILDWINTSSQELADYNRQFRKLHRDNVNMYAGYMGSKQNYWNGKSWENSAQERKDLNVIQPIVEAHLARITTSRANVSVLPIHSGEFNDLAAAKNAEAALQQSFEQRKFNDKLEDAVRSMLICGYSYVLVDWDDQIGPPLSQPGQEVIALDDDGNPVEDEDGNPMVLAPNIRLGDVNYKVLRPDQVLEQPGIWGETVDWVITVELQDVNRLRQQYPTVAGEINAGDPDPTFVEDYLTSAFRDVEQQIVVMTLIHRATPEFPDGWRVKATNNVILESTPLPYKSLNQYGMLPIERVHDTEVPSFHLPLPMTVMESGKGYAETFNRVDRVIRKDMSLSVPKWLVHQMSGVNRQQLNTLSNYVSFKGAVEPKLIRPPTTSGEFFRYRDMLLQELQVNTGSANLLNKPPPNTRAASMLQHLEEQEFTRSEPLIRHVNDFVSRLGKIAISVMADKYSEDPSQDSFARLIKLTGGKGPSSFIRLQVADLVGPYDVKYERTSALPESKQGRLNAAMQLFQNGLIDGDQYKKVIGFNSDPELASAEDKAYEKQLLENDLMFRGEEVGAPLEYEDHVEHLKALYPVIESVEFAEAPAEIKSLYIAHCMAHEMFAWQRAQISLRYALKVERHVKWMFFSALPSAMPVSVDNPAAAQAEDISQARLTTPGLSAPEPAGPDNPDAV